MNKQNVLFLGFLFLYLLDGSNGFLKCQEQRTEKGFLCVCSRNHCDTTPETPKIKKGSVHFITSAKDLPGFNINRVNFTPKNEPFINATVLHLNRKKRFQKLKGFGGSFSDAFGLNVLSLSKKNQLNLLRSYFGQKGLRYNLCRVPIGGTDFSPRYYTYDDTENDIRLEHFNLTREDFSLKIPIIKRAMKIAPRKVNLFASNWSPPHWMKVDQNSSSSYLKERFYQLYADYQIKFLEEYRKENLNFWGITAFNEPLTGLAIHFTLENLIMTPELERKWIGHHFGPSLAAKGFGDLKIMALDDQRKYVFWYLDTIMADKEAAKYLSGVALHWYFDKDSPTSLLDRTHRKYPGKFILYTESSINKAISDEVINLGSWFRGALYAHNIIENLNHWSVGWVDWNMALDMKGGPNYINGNCEAPILVDKEKDEFYKQPMYYTLGQFSAFTSEGSVRLDLSQVDDLKANIQKLNYVPPWPIPVDPVPISIPEKLHSTATKNKDGSTTLFLLNGKKEDVNVTIVDATHGFLHVTLRGESMNSFVYW